MNPTPLILRDLFIWTICAVYNNCIIIILSQQANEVASCEYKTTHCQDIVNKIAKILSRYCKDMRQNADKWNKIICQRKEEDAKSTRWWQKSKKVQLVNLYCGIGQGSLGRLHSARLYRVLCLNCKACKQVSTQQPWQDSPSTLLEKSTKWRSPSRLTQVSTPTSRQRRFCINFAILRRTLLIFIFSSAHYCLVPYKTWWYVGLKIKLDNC